MKRDGSIILQIQLSMPESSEESEAKKAKQCEYKQSVEERVKHCLELIDSGHESFKEWEIIRKLNNQLRERLAAGKLNRRGLAILKMIEPVIQKYGIESNSVVDDSKLLNDRFTK